MDRAWAAGNSAHLVCTGSCELILFFHISIFVPLEFHSEFQVWTRMLKMKRTWNHWVSFTKPWVGFKSLEGCKWRNLSETYNSFLTKFRAKPETRQVLWGSVRNILFSSSLGLTFGVCGTMCFLLLHKMSQYSNMPDYFLNLCWISFLLSLSGAEPAPRPLGNEFL